MKKEDFNVNFSFNFDLFTEEDEKSLAEGRNELLACFVAEGWTKESIGFDYNSMNQFIPHALLVRELTENRHSFPQCYILAAAYAVNPHTKSFFDDKYIHIFKDFLLRVEQNAIIMENSLAAQALNTMVVFLPN
jgi:hypothetical protein